MAKIKVKFYYLTLFYFIICLKYYQRNLKISLSFEISEPTQSLLKVQLVTLFSRDCCYQIFNDWSVLLEKGNQKYKQRCDISVGVFWVLKQIHSNPLVVQALRMMFRNEILFSQVIHTCMLTFQQMDKSPRNWKMYYHFHNNY